MGTAEQVTKASSWNTFPAVGSAEEIRVRRRTLEVVLEQCHRALEQLQMSEDDGYLAEEDTGREEESSPSVSSSALDNEADELCNLVKSRVESAAFLEKLGSIDISACPDVSDDSASWDMVTSNDLWDDKQILVDNESDEDSYVLIRQEEIVDGIACFMAAYLLSLKDSKLFAKHSLGKREKADFEKLGMVAKLFITWHLGVLQLSAYIKIRHCLELHQWSSLLRSVQYLNYSKKALVTLHKSLYEARNGLVC